MGEIGKTLIGLITHPIRTWILIGFAAACWILQVLPESWASFLHQDQAPAIWPFVIGAGAVLFTVLALISLLYDWFIGYQPAKASHSQGRQQEKTLEAYLKNLPNPEKMILCIARHNGSREITTLKLGYAPARELHHKKILQANSLRARVEDWKIADFVWDRVVNDDGELFDSPFRNWVEEQMKDPAALAKLEIVFGSQLSSLID